MSLIGALNAGKTALAVQQAAIQVTGNNISNAGNADYTRQTALVVPSRDQQIRPGVFMGTGVDLTGVQRNIDESLLARIRAAISDNAGADVTQQWLGRVEAVFNELGDQDLSTRLSTFFSSWSNLANKPEDMALRQVVLQNGQSLAQWIQSLRTQFTNLQGDADSQMQSLVTNADSLAQQVADLNGQIVVAEGANNGTANSLRDQRDAVLKQLSQLVDIQTTQDGNVTNVYVGSEPLVIGTENRGVSVRQENVDGRILSTVIFRTTNGAMKLSSGRLGALAQAREQIQSVAEQLDSITHHLIFELNKVHSSGQGLTGYTSVTGSNSADDPTRALNDEDSGIDFPVSNGSFVLHVRNKTTGLVTSTLIKVDLDGQGGNDTTLNSLAAAIDGVDNVSASVVAGKLKIASDSANVDFSFSQDSSGALAALGINNFFTGKDARDIAVNAALTGNPSLLAAAKNGNAGDNQTATAIAKLESLQVDGLNGATLTATYEAMVNGVAVKASNAKTNLEATTVVQTTLETQREALSGVSLDEEAVNLMKQQRAYQAAARLVSAVDELMKTLLGMVQ